MSAGIGITSGGDDVSVPEAAEINLAHVFQPDGESSPRGVGVFVLQPLEVIDEIAPDEDSQCQWDKERDPFDDEQIIDGSRIVFFPWPEDILGPVPPVQNQRFRNRLAYRIFEYELRHYSGQFHISGEHFCLTEEALKGIHRALRKGDEIDFMLKRLTRLRTRMSISRSSFEDALKKTIGEVRTKKFQSMMDDVLHVLKRDEALIIPGAVDQLKTFMTQLAGLKDQEFNSEERFLEALKQAIGEEQTRAHESLITEHAALDKYYYEPLPWEKLGVPLGLGYIVDDGRVRFIDQSAVVRQGGAPMSIDPLMKHNGTPFLWEARIQQFIEHLYAIRQAADDLPPAESYFEILPPVGVLPKQALNLDDMGTPFFPSQFVINAVPIPEEQVEVAMNASAGLEPIDLYLPEKIKLLVPVPQAVYEPDLLKKEIPDPIFLETLRKLIHQIRICLAGRVSLRNMAPKVVRAIDVAQVPSFPEDDDPIPDEGKFRAPASGGEEISAFDERAVSAIRELYGWIKTHARYVSNTDIALLKVSKTMPPEYHQDFKGLSISIAVCRKDRSHRGSAGSRLCQNRNRHVPSATIAAGKHQGVAPGHLSSHGQDRRRRGCHSRHRRCRTIFQYGGFHRHGYVPVSQGHHFRHQTRAIFDLRHFQASIAEAAEKRPDARKTHGRTNIRISGHGGQEQYGHHQIVRFYILGRCSS